MNMAQAFEIPQPLKTAKAGAASVVVVHAGKGWASLPNTVLNPNTILGASRWGGQNQDPRWRVNPFTGEVMAWHEFGHAWGYINGRPLDRTNPEANAWENRMREQLYGPIGPNNAPRVAH
jgi:hypothetical protein